MKYTPNDLDTGDVITNVAVDNWDAGIVSANNSRRSDRMNLLSDAVALCESTDGWTDSNLTSTNDSSNSLVGTNCRKITLSSAVGNTRYDVLSLLSEASYYLVACSVKKGNLSGSGAFIAYTSDDTAAIISDYVTSASYTRVGFVIAPTDFDTATNARIRLYGDGTSSEYAYFDGLSLIEITASEYAEGVTALLAKFPFTYSKGQDSYTEINTLADDTVVCSGRLLSESQGLTDVNLLDDDDAGLEVTTDWTDSGGTSTNDTANKLEGTNCRKFTLSGSSGFTYKDFLAKLDITKHYLFTMHLENGDATNCYLAVNCVGDAGLLNNTGYAGTTYTRQGIAIQPSDFDTATEVRAQLIAIGANTEFVYAGTLMIQEITAEEYNAEVDPENVITLLKKYDYHRGLGSCEGVRVKSIGKNRFNKEDVTANVQTDNTDGTETASTGEYASHYIKIDDGDDIFISGCDNTANTDGAYYNFNKEYISGFTAYGALTIPTSATYFRYTIDYDDLDTAQVEKGTSATAYESYKESISYTPRVLRSVPTARDTFRHNDGVDTQRCEEYTLLSGDIDAYTTGTNVDYVQIGLDALSGLKTQDSAIVDGSLRINWGNGGEIGNDSIDQTIYEYWFRTTSANLFLVVPSGTYADVAAARTALTSTVTTKIVYELATPVVTYHPENIVNGYPSGTIYHEKAVEEELVYDTGLTITNTDLLIDSLDYVYKVNTDGSETPIAISDCTPNANGLSFTISSASNGELYRFAYYYFGTGTRGLASYGYCQNSKDESEGNTEGLKELNNKVNAVSTKVDQIITASGTITSFPSSIAVGASETVTTPIGIAGKFGSIQIDTTAGQAHIKFTDDINDAIGSFVFDVGSGARGSSANYNTDSIVVPGGLYAVLGNYISITECYLEGYNLVITYKCDYTSAQAVSITQLNWEVTV